MEAFSYCASDFVHKTSWTNECLENASRFDKAVQLGWQTKLHEGHFRYTLKIAGTKILNGKYKFLAQLNVDRALNRRTPAAMKSLAQPFDPLRFNFTQMRQTEIMFEIKTTAMRAAAVAKHVLAINVSPIEWCHCLLLPSLADCLPQLATLDSLAVAIHLILLSTSPALRIGFNSLCAYASVNHLHYHLYYLQHRMLLEYIKVEPFSGPCHQLTTFPARGFVFQLNDTMCPSSLASHIHKVTKYLSDNEIAHNVYLTRGMSFELSQSTDNDDGFRDCIRAYIWARTSVLGIKDGTSINSGLCELFGHLEIKNEEDYNAVTEDEISAILSDITSGPFSEVKESIRQLFV